MPVVDSCDFVTLSNTFMQLYLYSLPDLYSKAWSLCINVSGITSQAMPSQNHVGSSNVSMQGKGLHYDLIILGTNK